MASLEMAPLAALLLLLASKSTGCNARPESLRVRARARQGDVVLAGGGANLVLCFASQSQLVYAIGLHEEHTCRLLPRSPLLALIAHKFVRPWGGPNAAHHRRFEEPRCPWVFKPCRRSLLGALLQRSGAEPQAGVADVDTNLVLGARPCQAHDEAVRPQRSGHAAPWRSTASPGPGGAMGVP